MKPSKIIIAGMLFNAAIHASPTSNEFVPCKKRAVAILERCLQDNENNCWEKSEASYLSCYDDVIQSHVINPEQINEAIKRRNEMLEKKKLKDDIN